MTTGDNIVREQDLDSVRIALLDVGLSAAEADAILDEVRLLLED